MSEDTPTQADADVVQLPGTSPDEMTDEEREAAEADRKATEVAQLQEQAEVDKAINAHLQGRVVALRKAFNSQQETLTVMNAELERLKHRQPADRQKPGPRRTPAKKASAAKKTAPAGKKD